MMTKEELLKIAEEAKAKIDAATQEAIKKLEQGEYKSELWKPKAGEYYYYIDIYGETVCIIWSDDADDDNIYAFGNCFKTIDEAKEYALRLKYRRMYEAMGRPYTSGEMNYYAIYNIKAGTIDCTCAIDCIRSDVFFGSSIECGDAVKTIGEDNFKKYILGMKDGAEDVDKR